MMIRPEGAAPNPAAAAPAAAEHGPLRYRREIDGLRFWAVMPVILFHAGFGWIAGGYAGVDVFFVISGYLITSIVAREHAEGRLSILRFYERRVRRILPALYLVLTATTVGGWFILQPRDYANTMASLASVVVFASNFWFWRATDYFAPGAEITPLLHTWSLGVEEQFYLFFPIILVPASRLGRRVRNAILIVLLVVSLLLAEGVAGGSSLSTFYLLPARAWELLAGALAGLWLLERGASSRRGLNQAGSALGFVLLLAGLLLLHEGLPWPSRYTLVPVIGTVLIILCAVEGKLVQRLLGWAPFVWVGLISYSAYLWHQPIFALARYYRMPQPGWVEMIGWIALTLLVSWLSWRFLEAPFRDRERVSRGQAFTFGAIGGAVLFACGLYAYAAAGLPQRSVIRAHAPLRFDPDNRALKEASWQPIRRLTGSPDYEVQNNPADRLLWFSLGSKVKVLIVGNSHSKDLYNTLIESRRFTAVAQAARYGTQIHQLGEDLFTLPNYRAADVIVICSHYQPEDLRDFAPIAARILHDGKRLVLVRKVHSFPWEGDSQLVDHLVPRLYRSGESPTQVADTINHAYWNDFAHGPDREDRATFDRRIAALVRQFPQVAVVDRMDYLCEPAHRRCTVIGPQLEKYLADYGHYSLEGTRFYASVIDRSRWLDPIVGTAARR